jgi:ATP-dependent helicase HrpB
VAISQTAGILNRSKDPVLAQEQEFKFGNPSSDLLFELNAWIWAKKNDFKPSICIPLGINLQNARKTSILALQILKRTGFKNATENNLPHELINYEEEVKLRKCIFSGFIDFLAVKHKSNSPLCQLMYGKSAKIHPLSIVQDSRFMVATELEESKFNNSTQLNLRKLSKIEEEWLEEMSNFHIKIDREIIFDSSQKKVIELEKHIFNDLIISQKINEVLDKEKASAFLTDLVLKGELKFENWNEEVDRFINRANFAARNAPYYEIPMIDEDAKHFIIQQSLYKCRSLKDLEKANPWEALKSWFSSEQLAAIDYLAPVAVNLPHRKYPVKLRYDEKGDAILSETVQALYDCPPVMLCEGKVQVIYEILAPSRRPVQITRDLEQFWKGSYLEVKKELKGRYPKHEWR